MNKETINILEQSMRDIVLEAVSKVDIEQIMVNQIKSITESVASDIFSHYGDFSKQLKEKLKSELQVNIDAISVPEFGELAVNTVKSELAIIEHKQAEELARKAEETLRNILGVHNKVVKLKDLEDTFVREAWEDVIKYNFDSCNCDGAPNVESYENFLDYTDYNDTEYSFEFILHERTSPYSSWSSCISHLYLKLNKGTSTELEIALHVNRERDETNGETYENDDYYNPKHINRYKILGIEVNGKKLSDRETSTVILSEATNNATKQVLATYLNKQLIDADDLSNFEIESE